MSLVNYKRRAEAVKFEDQVFERLDLRSMKAFGSTWTRCKFNGCQMDLTDWRASKFEDCEFDACEMRLVNFATSFFEDCLFYACNLEQASFMGSHFRKTDFDHCRMAYGDTLFQDATVKEQMRLVNCNLHGSNLDFRQVEPKAFSADFCNLWGAKISMGCAFWEGSFDPRTVRQFLALVARVADDPRIAELAGKEYAVVQRAMDGVPKHAPAETNSTQTQTIPFPQAMTMTGEP